MVLVEHLKGLHLPDPDPVYFGGKCHGYYQPVPKRNKNKVEIDVQSLQEVKHSRLEQ